MNIYGLHQLKTCFQEDGQLKRDAAPGPVPGFMGEDFTDESSAEDDK